jgi:hypothetical protein
LQSPAGHDAACPFAGSASAAFGPATVLAVPRRRSMVAQRSRSPNGQPLLTLYHGGHEVTFDEPDLFPFAEGLAAQDAFLAAEATTWGDGYPWTRVQPLLEALLEAGVVTRAEDVGDGAIVAGVRTSPLPPARCALPRSWSETEELMQALTGRALEPGWLEMVVPVFRVAHISLDADGRQVGEANVFPPALRLDVPTRWRTCLYPGTRHQPDRPMNVEALRGMQRHWTQMMTALLRIRQAYLARCPAARPDGRLTIGEIERLAVCVLAIPTYGLVRARDPIASGALHPALSSLFRVTDGLRMVMHQMLFVPLGEPTRDASQVVGADEIHAYAERNYAFHSEHGVCAGPPHRVAEFLHVLVEGVEPQEGVTATLDSEVEAALSDLAVAMDYALLGLQVHAGVFSVWPAIARAYEAIAEALEAARAGDLARRFAAHRHVLKSSTYLGDESLRRHREAVYQDIVAACGSVLGDPFGDDDIAQQRRTARVEATTHAADLRRRLADQLPDAAVEPVLEAVLDLIAATAAAIAVGAEPQGRINRLLGRRQPRRPFDSVDLELHNRLNDLQPRRLPCIFDELADAFGLSLTITADGLDPALANPNSAAPPFGSRAYPHAPLPTGVRS